jgi:MSHA biogenesis protein MshN
MSIINQVLNELEKRGVNAPLGEETLRPVTPRKQSHLILYALLVLLLLILLVAVKWYRGRSETPALEKYVVMTAPTGSTVPVPSSAPLAAISTPVEMAALGESGVPQSVDSLHGKPLIEVKSEEEPVVVPEAKKVARSKVGRARASVADNTDSLLEEDPGQLKTISPLQRAENEFSKGNLAVREGRTNDALADYESALLADPTYKPARRAWAGLLVSLKRNDEAGQVLQRGLNRDSNDTFFAMQLARLQVERGDVPLALETLQKTLPYAGEQADYQSFVAALQQRQGRHEEAIAHYQTALKLVPNNGLWLMGMGISLQAMQRKEEARDAYQRALASNSLSGQLQAFVQQKLKELQLIVLSR